MRGGGHEPAGGAGPPLGPVHAISADALGEIGVGAAISGTAAFADAGEGAGESSPPSARPIDSPPRAAGGAASRACARIGEEGVPAGACAWRG